MGTCASAPTASPTFSSKHRSSSKKGHSQGNTRRFQFTSQDQKQTQINGGHNWTDSLPSSNAGTPRQSRIHQWASTDVEIAHYQSAAATSRLASVSANERASAISKSAVRVEEVSHHRRPSQSKHSNVFAFSSSNQYPQQSRHNSHLDNHSSNNASRCPSPRLRGSSTLPEPIDCTEIEYYYDENDPAYQDYCRRWEAQRDAEALQIELGHFEERSLFFGLHQQQSKVLPLPNMLVERLPKPVAGPSELELTMSSPLASPLASPRLEAAGSTSALHSPTNSMSWPLQASPTNQVIQQPVFDFMKVLIAESQAVTASPVSPPASFPPPVASRTSLGPQHSVSRAMATTPVQAFTHNRIRSDSFSPSSVQHSPSTSGLHNNNNNKRLKMVGRTSAEVAQELIRSIVRD